MKNQIIGVVAISAISWGCATNWFSASTETCYRVGDTEICHRSTKTQENFKATVGFYPNNTIKDLTIQTTATTAESAVASASANLATMTEILTKLFPFLLRGAMAGGN